MEDIPPEMKFDRGTLSISGIERAQAGQLGCLWDERVNHLRAPAHEYDAIRGRLPQGCRDAVGSKLSQGLLEGQWLPISLRPYQEAALMAWQNNHKRGVIIVPTGAGKTRIAIAAMANLGVSTLCVVPTRVLLAQWVAQIREFYSGPLGIFGDGSRELQSLTIATFESAYRYMSEWGDRFQLLVIDEVHHFGGGLRDEALEMAIAPMRLGLSASIEKDDPLREYLSRIVGQVVYEIGMSELAGIYLAEFESVSLRLPLLPDEAQRYSAEMRTFNQFYRTFQSLSPGASWGEMLHYAGRSDEGRRAITALRRARQLVSFTWKKAEALTHIMRQHKSSRVIIFTGNTRDAYRISAAFLIPVITSAIDRKERERIVVRFREGAFRTLVSCRVLNEGFDVPDAEIAVITGGTHGEREHIQRVGRILRPKEGKIALVYDLIADNTIEMQQAARRAKALRR
jgi:superfamily II DNA or RNA helicase